MGGGVRTLDTASPTSGAYSSVSTLCLLQSLIHGMSLLPNAVLLLLSVVAAGTTALDPSVIACHCFGPSEPLCGSNLKTYRNLCHFDCVADVHKGLMVLYRGRCDVRNCKCPYRFGAVCGSDRRTYPDECILRCAAQKRPHLTLRHPGRCGVLEREPFRHFGAE